MPELRSVTLSREQRDALARIAIPHTDSGDCCTIEVLIRAWDAAKPLACPECNGTGLTPSLEGCGVRVQCRACHGTGRA